MTSQSSSIFFLRRWQHPIPIHRTLTPSIFNEEIIPLFCCNSRVHQPQYVIPRAEYCMNSLTDSLVSQHFLPFTLIFIVNLPVHDFSVQKKKKKKGRLGMIKNPRMTNERNSLTLFVYFLCIGIPAVLIKNQLMKGSFFFYIAEKIFFFLIHVYKEQKIIPPLGIFFFLRYVKGVKRMWLTPPQI